MSFDVRLLVVGLAAFAIANLGCCALVPWLWRRRTASSIVRAEQLRHVRLFPALVSALVMTLVAASFTFFEPRVQEPVGILMILLASLAAVLFGSAVVRLIRFVLIARAARVWGKNAEAITLDGWSGPASAIDAEFPIVAVVGVWQPRLVIARTVIEHCTPEELRAILAHEQAHANRRDNLGRLLLAVTPDVISWLPLSTRIVTAWHEATEEAADENTLVLGERGRVLLASALIRVARLASGMTPVAIPTSALYRGENIERRVRRLLSPLQPVTVRWSLWQRRAGRAAFVLACVLALHGVYEIVEAAVTFLP
jgi:beta-lactamase regulating signal transducer with metallopeptidase domain